MSTEAVQPLPDDPAALKSIIATITRQRDEAARQRDEAQLKALRLEHQLEQLKKRYYGPRADKLDLGQLLLEFAVALEARPINPDDLPPPMSLEQAAASNVRRVRRGRRKIADLHKLPVLRNVHDLSVSNHLNPATCYHFKCRHFEEARFSVVGFAASRRRELANGKPAQDGRASGNHRACTAELVVSPDRHGTWRGSGDGVPARKGSRGLRRA